MRVLLFAMAKEAAPPFDAGEPVENGAGLTLRRLSKDLAVCLCGVGKVNVALGAQYLIDRFAPTELWNAGVTGCLTDLPAGTIVAATACVQHDMETFGDPPGLIPVLEQVELPCAGADDTLARLAAAGFDPVPGIVASGDWFGRDLKRAQRIRDHFHALVCDMEAAAAAQVCLRNAVPFRCVKVVSDHLFQPSQYEEYQANLPGAVQRLTQALCALELA